jgi:apolipoprotein N-acyltransferase
MKKKSISFISLFLIFLSGCISSPQIITEEVTRIRIITSIQTNIPTATKTCYDEANTQYELNHCSGLLAEESRKEMYILVELVISKFSMNLEKAQEFINLQEEWELLAEKECELWYGRIIKDSKTGTNYYENGSMAPMLEGKCLQNKYEDRAKELKWLFDF